MYILIYLICTIKNTNNSVDRINAFILPAMCTSAVTRKQHMRQNRFKKKRIVQDAVISIFPSILFFKLYMLA